MMCIPEKYKCYSEKKIESAIETNRVHNEK